LSRKIVISCPTTFFNAQRTPLRLLSAGVATDLRSAE